MSSSNRGRWPLRLFSTRTRSLLSDGRACGPIDEIDDRAGACHRIFTAWSPPRHL
jgi:hypothetical protein